MNWPTHTKEERTMRHRLHTKGKLGRRSFRLLTVSAGILAVAGGVAYATIPNSTTSVISGCYGKTNGLLRVIDAQAGKKCTSLEVPISWNQKGQQGIQGLQGPKGDQGETGAQGPQGSSGQDGVGGAAGAPGQTGPQGEQGPVGPAGAGVAWRGSYDALNTYAENDAVSREGSSYVSKTTVPTGCPPPGQLCSDDFAPPNAAYWSVLAERGSPGPPGGQGLQGDTGPQGSKGDPGPAGTAALSVVNGPRESNAIGNFGVDEATSTCPPGTLVVGGEFFEAGPTTDVQSVRINPAANSFTARAGASLGGGIIIAEAHCLRL
jgi:collagen triple helix repeat protein